MPRRLAGATGRMKQHVEMVYIESTCLHVNIGKAVAIGIPRLLKARLVARD